MPRYKFIDLFAGIGGFHIAFHNAGMSCVFACEIDKYARKTYIDNLMRIKSSELREFADTNAENYVVSNDQYLFGCANEFANYSSGFEDNSKLARLQLMGRGFNIDPPEGSDYTEAALSRYETIEEMFYGQGDPQSPSILFEQNTYDVKNKILKMFLKLI